MRKLFTLNVAASSWTAPVNRPARRHMNADGAWSKILMRSCPTAFTALLAISCAAFNTNAFGADGGSYRYAMKQVWKEAWGAYQSREENPARQITRKIEEAYGRFEKGMDGVIEAVNGRPLPAMGDGKFDDDIAELQRKVDTLAMPDLHTIPAFPIGIMGLSRDALRQEIRAGVGFVFAARSGTVVGNGFIDELQSNQENINSFAVAIRKYGQSLNPLLALGYFPITQPIAFNVIDLQFHYPDQLSLLANKVTRKKEAALEQLAAHNRNARSTIDYLIAALDAEDLQLRQDRLELAAQSKEEKHLADALADQIRLYTEAARTSMQSDDALETMKSTLIILNRKIAQGDADVQHLTNEVNRRLQEAHNSYGPHRVCPNVKSWDECDHVELKNHFMNGNFQEPLAYRLARSNLEGARLQLERDRQERDSSRKRLPYLERDAASNKRMLEAARQEWQNAAAEKNAFTKKFDVWKKETKIALYSSENEKDRRDLAQVRPEFN